MAGTPRYLLRLRQWPWRSCGPMWVCSSEPGSSLLGPACPSFLERVAGDMRRHVEEVERIRRAVFLARPAVCWEPASRVELGQSGPAPAGEAKEEPGSHGRREEAFQLSVDVAGFSPEELRVHVEGRQLTVTGKRERRHAWDGGGHGQEYRELCAEAVLPEDVDRQAVTCSLSREGELCIQAPRLAQPAGQGRAIPISIKPEEHGKGPAGESEGPRGS
ncbi:heat shock protein beta-11-like [Carettochelys insculpta]|uniref:heat shock protein beta-11-like n=1 Tax=Carettochelys insculpta TaxID=44489 RepID=UPI003EB80D79